MDNLEHKIKEAFAKNDAQTSFPGKDAMWNRMDETMHRSKGVAAWWRVAAVFIGLFLVAGVYAGLNYHSKQQVRFEGLQSENAELRHTIDSLLAIPIQRAVDTKIVEKVVYRERVISAKKTNADLRWQKKYMQLKDSTQILLTNQKTAFQQEIEQREAELTKIKDELVVLQSQSQSQKQQKKKNEPFQLKSERVELGTQNSSAPRNPDIELKIFPGNFTENKNDLNKLLLKNK